MKTILMSFLVLFAVACGKDDEKSSKSNSWGSAVGVPSTQIGLITLIPPQQGVPTIRVGNTTYQVGPNTTQAAWSVMTQMLYGQVPVQPHSMNGSIRVYKASITASISVNYNQNQPYPNNNPVSGNVLDVQSVQPLNP